MSIFFSKRKRSLAALLLLSILVALSCFIFLKLDDGTPSYIEKTIQLAEGGDVVSQNEAGLAYQNGLVVKGDIHKALYWFNKAADQGYADSQNHLGNIYTYGKGVPVDVAKGLHFYKRAAEQNFAPALGNIGLAYKDGVGVEKNEKEAVQWFMKAAEQGEPNAQVLLAAAYEDGAVMPQDYQQAKAWYMRAAEQGNAAAQANLGRMFLYGIGGPISYYDAGHWYSLSSKQKYRPAQETLSRAVSECKSAKEEKSAQWCLVAAHSDDPVAQYVTADAFLKGKLSLPVSKESAFIWFQKSAFNNFSGAQIALSKAYAEGSGVEKDDIEALAWLCVVLNKNESDPIAMTAAAIYTALSSGMDAADILTAKEKADQYSLQMPIKPI